ncbi:hypothetical protein KJ996_06645, partial [Patescibacteria group bacterium]|nr:hypothetical protein [Patescibacteria group bacterium]
EGNVYLGGATTVGNDVILTTGTLDVKSGSDYALAVSGSWDNDGTFQAQNGIVTFDAASGTETIDGDGIGTDTFYDVVFNDGGGGAEWDLTGALDVANDFAITGGTVDNSAGNYNINIGGGWDNDDTYTRGTETVTFDAASGTHSIDADSPADDDFYSVVFNDSAGSAEWQLTSQPMQVDGNMTITDGILNLNNYDLYITGNLTKNGGSIDQDQASDLVNLWGDLVIDGSDSPVDPIIAGSWYARGNITISGDDTWLFGGSGYPSFYPRGDTDTTLSMSGANNNFYDGNGEFRILKDVSTAKFTLNSNLLAGNLNVYEGILDINGYTLSTSYLTRFQDGSQLKMSSGTLIAGYEYAAPSSYAMLHFQSGSTEDITGGTIQVNGYGNTTYGLLHIEDGSNFTPTGGTIEIIGPPEDARTNIYVAETDAADFNFHNLTIGDGSNAKVVQINAASQVIDVNGDFTIASTSEFDTNGIDIEVAGNWTNNSTYTANSNEVTLDGSAEQEITGTLTSSSAFYDLTISNSSGSYAGCEISITPGIDFGAAVTVGNTYTITTDNAKVEYESGATFTVGNGINWNATPGNDIVFRNSNLSSGTWLLDVTGAQTAVSDVNVARSDASSGSEIAASDGTNSDCGNNTNWNFGSTMSIWGNTYNENTTSALTECDDGTNMISLRVGGTTYTSTCADSDGTFTFTGVTQPAADTPMVMWIDGQTPNGTTVNAYSGSGNVTGMVVEENAL